jgi:glycosyltransferase involved in cell wall biosynthesis
MKVAMLGWEFPPFISGGLGVHCFELTRALGKRGVKIDFFMPKSGKKVESNDPNLRIIGVAETNIRPYLMISKTGRITAAGEKFIDAVQLYNSECEQAVLEMHKTEKYDLVHAHDWLTAKAAAGIKEKTGLSIVQTFHSTEFDRTSVPWDFILDIERMAAQKADIIIAVSQRTRAQVLRLGADERKIRVVYNGVDSAKFTGIAPSRTAEEFKNGRRTVLFLGRLTEQKGPVQFLHAAKKVVQVMPDTLFLIVGTGELLPLLINLSLELGISKNVSFLGYVSDSDQRKIYSASDLYVMPSTSEPFGITALEAMASGTPVIISRTSGVSEVIRSALRVDFWDINGMAEKMVALLKYRPLRSTMGGMAQDDARKLTWDKTAEETQKVYGEAFARK